MSMDKNYILIPPDLINIFKLYRARIAHGRKVNINSHFVSPKAKLAYGVGIGQGTVVSEYATMGRHSYAVRNCQIISANIASFVSIANNVSIGAFEHNYPICTNSAEVRKLLDIEATLPTPTQIGNDAIIKILFFMLTKIKL